MAPHTLPSFTIPFIGRTDELRQISDLLRDSACRLLTLTGPGGIGKTRLAVEAARLTMAADPPAFSDGCCYVPLQPLTSSASIVPVIANALHFKFYGKLDSKQQLLNFLEETRLLLVLDNFEHLTAGADLLPEILAAAPRLKVLVTSRERLRLREEWLVNVGGLTVPEDAQPGTWDDFTAVQLFLQSARRAGYVSRESDAASIVRICQAVEGSPLAVELAAAWVRVMPCAEIAREVERNLDILTSTARNAPENHRSIQVAFERSWELLTAEEQAVFRKLSVFRGGFTRAAAEQVAGATLPILVSLVDKSLVQARDSGRFDLHELLRQYAANKLRDAGAEDTATQHHLDYFLRLAEGVEAHVFGREQVVWFDQAEVNLDNLRAAFHGSTETETGLRLAGALGWFFSERSHWREGLDWLEQTIAANPDAPVSLRVKALHNAGALAGHLGDRRRATAYCEQALALARAANDNWNTAWALSQQGSYVAHSLAQSAALYDESLALFRMLGDSMGLAHTLMRRAWIALAMEDRVHARELMAETARLANDAGDRVMSAWVIGTQATNAWVHEHDLEKAKALMEESLALFREAHVQLGCDNTLLGLATVELALGYPELAQRHYEEALNSLRVVGPGHVYLAYALIGMASIATTRGQFKRAARLLGAVNDSSASIRSLGYEAGESADIMETAEATARAQLGETAFAEAWAAGSAMTRLQAIDYALEHEAPTAKSALAPTTSQRANSGPTEALNVRQLEVLALVADGLSNREIAGRLFLSVNTVKWYLKGIFSKLEVSNRAEAVAQAQALSLWAK